MIIKDNNPKDSKHWTEEKNDHRRKDHPKLRKGTTQRQADSIRTEVTDDKIILIGGGPNDFPYQLELTKGDIPHIW